VVKQKNEFLMKNHETKLVMLDSQKWMQQHLMHIFVIIKEISKRNFVIRSGTVVWKWEKKKMKTMTN